MDNLPSRSENIRAFLKANAEYVKKFPDKDKNLPARPSRRLIIVTCMDARFHPVSAFAPALTLGSTHIIRNAGGKAEEAIPSIEISQTLDTNEILLIKHTKCGAYSDQVDIEKEVRRDVDLLRSHPRVKRGTIISGWVYDVDTGEARMVDDHTHTPPPKD
ncbi:carbonic anhydrase [Tuber indicum]|nr:carbonic anhydrase [Tuber indicum]